jgi:hypothetical protein
VSEHAAVAGSSLDLDEAVVAPPVAPAVLDQPEVLAGLVAVADDGDSVIVLVAGVGIF